MSKSKKVAEELADRLMLPAEICAGSAKLTVCGKRHVLVENHKGILSYGDELVELDCGDMIIRLRGDELRLAAMDKQDIAISGKLLVIEFD